MPDREKYLLGIKGRKPGDVNNTVETRIGQESNTFFAFTDATTSPVDGDLLEGRLPHNGLVNVNWDNVDGGQDSVPMQLRYYFDRNGVSATDVQISVNVQMWGILDDDDMSPKILTVSFTNTDSTDTSEKIANHVLRCLNGTTPNCCVDQDGNAANINGELTVVDENESDVGASYSYASGFAFRLKAKNINLAIAGSINYSGQLNLTKFEQLPAFSSPGFDVITRDIDFGFPGVRKKVYKVIVTYKAPFDMGGAAGEQESNIKPYYSLNGKMRLKPDKLATDWKDTLINGDSTLVYLPTPVIPADGLDTRWQRAELKPAAGSSAWNNIYSMAIRFRTPDSLNTKGFEINDISVVYRLKSPK